MNHNNKVLSEQERIEFCELADKVINDFTKSIEILFNMHERLTLEEDGWLKKKEDHLIDLRLFVSYCYCDIVILTKQFILSTHYYEKAFTYGKLKVVLNESFKKLYGFTKSSQNKSYFAQLKEAAKEFPKFKDKLEMFSNDLDEMSRKKTWWKEERNAEVHLDVKMLDKFRNKDVYEGQVILDVISIFDIFDRINELSSSIHQTVTTYASKDELPTAFIFKLPVDHSLHPQFSPLKNNSHK